MYTDHLARIENLVTLGWLFVVSDSVLNWMACLCSGLNLMIRLIGPPMTPENLFLVVAWLLIDM